MVTKKIKEEYLHKLMWIPKTLSYDVFNLNRLGFSRKDFEQELKISLWKAINSYFEKDIEFTEDKISSYCYTSCYNAKVDILRKLNREKRSQVYVAANSYTDYGFNKDSIIFSETEILYDNIDLLQDIDCFAFEKGIFIKKILGYKNKDLCKLYNVECKEIKNSYKKIREQLIKNDLEIFSSILSKRTLLMIEGDVEDFNEFDYSYKSGDIKASNLLSSINRYKNNKLNKFKKYIEKGG